MFPARRGQGGLLQAYDIGHSNPPAFRILLINVRRRNTNAGPEFMIKFRKEVAVERDNIERKLLNFAEDVRTNSNPHKFEKSKKLHLQFYEKSQPSSRKNNGGNLISPKIISYPRGGEPEDFIKEYLS